MSSAARTTPSLRDSLRDSLLTILSLASVEGTERVRLTEFYRAFANVIETHTDAFPPMLFTRGAYSVYSKRLDDALQSLIGYSISLPNPSLQYIELKPDVALRHLAWLRDTYSSKEVDSLVPLAEEFVEQIGPKVEA